MTAQPTNAEKIRKLRWGLAKDSANTVFVQFTFFGSVFVLFLNEIGLSNSQIGLLLSFFPFFGIVAVFIAPQVAQFGYKRTFITFWFLRKFIAMLLLFVPWVMAHLGANATMLFVGFIVMGFGLFRSIAETGYYPWFQEYVPNSVRGRYTATNNLFANITGIVSVTIASIVMEELTGLNRFMLLFGVGIAFGFASVWMTTHLPGGASVKGTQVKAPTYRDMLKPLKDKNFLLFIVGIGFMSFASVPMFSFLPLFMEQQVGLSDGNVVLLQNGAMAGTLAATYLMGWAADRYGAKPVLMSGIAMTIFLPFGWLLMPRFSDLSLPIALAIAFARGISQIAWGIGLWRLLFVNMVPTDKKSEYMAVYYALVGLLGGFSQLIGGAILDLTQNLSGQLGFLTLDPFTPLFLMGTVLGLGSFVMFHYVRSDGDVGVTEFAALFMRGNPLMAFNSMMRYYWAKDERAVVSVTESLGQSHSPLTVDELLMALEDPRFNVRFEAIISIARSNPDVRLVDALTKILNGTELSLTTIAAWALGRIGDTHAIEALRHGLDSEYRSICAHCARALGTLGDESIVPLLLERLETETDKGLQMAYASALGSLSREETVDVIMQLLHDFENEGARIELALALGRIIGQGQNFVRLLRQMRQEISTATAQAVMSLRSTYQPLIHEIDETADAFAKDEMEAGVVMLIALIRQITLEDAGSQHLLMECADALEQFGASRIEYILLALHVLQVKS